MSGSGHTMDMINRVKQNRAQRPSNRPKFKDNRAAIQSDTDTVILKPTFKTVSKEKLYNIKQSILKRATAENKQEYILHVIFFTSSLIILIATLFILNNI